MSLPTKAIDRVFSRLGATYGAEWDRCLGSAPIGDVKAVWGHELAGFAGRLQDIAWALENLPERCPNAIAFRNLCRQAPHDPMPQLAAPPADPLRVAAELEKLAEVRKAPAEGGAEPRAWAHRILARVERGERVNRTAHRFAREALGLPV